MIKCLKRIISIVLSVAILITAVPIVIATAQDSALTGSVPETETGENSEAVVLQEITEKREPGIKHFRMSDGSINAAVYPYEVHYQDEDGNLADIDNRLTDGNDGSDDVLANGSNIANVQFMKKSNPNKLFTINKGDHKIKVSIAGVAKVNAVKKDAEEPQVEGKFKLDKIGSSIEYNDILENTDIQYSLVSTRLKENIIIKDAVDFNSLEYTYHLNGGLTAVQEDSKTINIYEKGSDEFVFSIEAPAMWDAAGNYTDDLSIEITELKNSKLTVTLSWQIAEDAVYPVTVDPVMKFSTVKNQIHDTYIRSDAPASNFNVQDHLMVRYGGSALIKFPTPTELNSGDKVVYAELQLVPYLWHNPNASYSTYTNHTGSSTPLYITAHKINNSWAENTVTYNSAGMNNGFYDSTVCSYHLVEKDDDFYRWDITRIVSEWIDYGSANNGVLLKFDKTLPDVSIFTAFFCSADGLYTNPAAYPHIIYQYINTTGIEDYFSYHTQGLGRAGTGYTNDLTGNITIINPVVSTGGSLMPVSATLVYNSANAFNTNPSTPYGTAWKLNWAQKMDWSVTSTIDNRQYLKYNDSDGTDHYFTCDQTTGIWTDEINPDRKVYTLNSGAQYKMTDSSGTNMYFTRKSGVDEWYLTKVEDIYGNYITVTLDSTDKNRVNRVESSTDNVLTFTYNSSGLLTSINYTDLNSSNATVTKSITIGYNALVTNNSISSITYPDGKVVQYKYYDYSNGTAFISQVVDISGQSVKYEYNREDTPPRVSSIAEYSSDATPVQGNKVTIQYLPTGTVFNDVTNSRQYLYTFAANGTLKSVVDITKNKGVNSGQYYEYNNGNPAVTTGAGNLTFMSKVQSSAVNLLRNHSFEKATPLPSFQQQGSDTVTDTGARSTARKRTGSYSYKITRSTTSTSTNAIGYYSATLTANRTYTLSAYVNTASMTSNGGGAFIAVGNLLTQSSEYITTKSNQWQRLTLTFTPTTSGTATLCMGVSGAIGSVYFDDFQLENSDLSEYNLLENPGFEQDTASNPVGWDSFSGSRSITTSDVLAGSRCALLQGNIDTEIHYCQEISMPGGKAGDAYVASAFAKAASVPYDGYYFSVLVRFLKNGATVNEKNIPFNKYTTEWQRVSDAAVADGEYDAVQFLLLYHNNCNSVRFDNASLVKDSFGTAYTYDDKGNLITTVDLQGKAEYTFNYDGNNQLISQTSLSGSQITYDYNDTKVQQLDSVAAGGLTTNFTYDTMGNALTSKTTVGSDFMASSATYSPNGEYLLTSTDGIGGTTQYSYNTKRGYLESATAPNGTVTEYAYNDSELLESVSAKNPSLLAKADYQYNTSDLLTRISLNNGTKYTFNYDSFGRAKSSYVGTSRRLSTKYYDSKGRLYNVNYGNGTSVVYGFDALGRAISTTINSVQRFKYVYDSASRPLETIDLAQKTKYKYQYDLLGRAVSEKLIDTETNTTKAQLDVKYDDAKNRITSYTAQVNGISTTTGFTYGAKTAAPDLIRAVKYGSSTMLYYSYDSFNRLNTRTVYVPMAESSADRFTTTYSYKKITGTNQTTSIVQQVNNKGKKTDGSTYNVIHKYSYDTNGNIIGYKVNDTVVANYTYDSLNQLKTVSTDEGLRTYNYDTNGNITSVVKTYGGSSQTIKTYVYGNSVWKDLLTGYNGQSITYDNIGNPLSYRGMTLSWSDGRKLTGATNGNKTLSFTYGSGGERTSKTVNNNTTNYYWLDGKLMAQHDVTSDTYLVFLYDESGNPYGFRQVIPEFHHDVMYFYEFNGAGDVTGIINSYGEHISDYTYDEWGKVISITGNTIAQENPIRYRSYYYDDETELYYLNSRYYDPETGRFINADGYISTGQGLLGNNMFAYCLNNPVNLRDSTGCRADENGTRGGFVIVTGDNLVTYDYSNSKTTITKVEKRGPSIPAGGTSVYKGQPRICTDGSDGTLVEDKHRQSTTAFSYSIFNEQTKKFEERFYDAYTVPYVVLPAAKMVNGIQSYSNSTGFGKNDSALVINWDTGQSIWCIVGDTGPVENGWGEVSINVLWQTGHPDHMTANHASGISSNYEIIMYKGKMW